MSGRARMGNGGLAIAQIGRNRDQSSRIDEAPGGLLASSNLEAHHRTEPLLLTLGQLVLWMAGQTRIVDALDTGLLLEPFGKLRSEGHTSELQSLMRISYAVFCLKK